MADDSGIQKTVKKPVVSVCMPCYNAERTIADAVASVLRQDVPLELIIIDDGSTDGSELAISPFLSDPRVRFLKNGENLGACRTRNRAVARAKAPWVAFLDADDIWEESKLRKQLALLDQTSAVLCGTGRELMKPDGTLTGRVIGVSPVITWRRLLRHNCINCSSVVVRTDVAREFPMEGEEIHEDYVTWLRILKKYKEAVGINEPLLKYRLSADGKSGSKFKSAWNTYRVYRYIGFGRMHAAFCFARYALHGVWKYLTA